MKKLIKKIERLAENRGLEFRTDYSGRGMFGKDCVGIVGENGECAALASLIQRKTGYRYSSDNMGRDMVYYFPAICKNPVLLPKK